MRFFVYACTFCLSLYFIFNPITSPADDPYKTNSDLVRIVQHEYGYRDFSTQHLRVICGICRMLQRQQIDAKGPFQSACIHGVEGTFYSIPSEKAVLYCPPTKEKYMLGRGFHKKAYKALYCTNNDMEVVAACIGDKTVLHESEILKMFSLPKEINVYRCSFALPSKKHMLVLRYYNMGSFASLQKKGVVFTEAEKIQMARGACSVVMEMHKQNLAHRDLHNGNFLVHRSHDGTLTIGVIDFGRALHMYAKSKNNAQGASKRNPPEVFLIPMKEVNKKKSDSYALGCFLFSLFFDKEYEGALIFNSHTFATMSHQDRLHAYELVKEKYESARATFFESMKVEPIQGKRTHVDTFKMGIFQMIHPDPSQRADVSDIAHLLEIV